VPRRVHGKAPSKARVQEKENIRDHPNTPRLSHRSVVDLVPSRPSTPSSPRSSSPRSSR
jgi:hypothetical protein